MIETTDPPSRMADFRAAIAGFIRDRHEAKTQGMDAEAAAALASRYDYSAWLADAARRVRQIQAVTHVLKATHPDARGSSLHVAPTTLPSRSEIGTHTLGADYADDIVGNAAALDVYKFLKLQVEGRRLLDWLLQDDADLLAALDDDPAIARTWADAFKALVRPASALASHVKAKQVYWLVADDPSDDAGFHLLQPMFSSALAHAVHAEINDARFGEANTEARRAYYAKPKQSHDGVYREYRNLAVRKLGGSKPQNISQLNSERGGVNYLFNSLPPRWQAHPKNFYHIGTAFVLLKRHEGVPALLRQLRRLLEKNPKPTMETRQQREDIEQSLGMALAAFGLATQQRLPAGWTRDADCELPLYEQLWLDPGRARLAPRENHEEEDAAFASAFEWKDWPDEVATRFALEINAILRKHGLPVGDVEVRHWARQAIVEAVDWPATMRRRVTPLPSAQEATYG
jgi:CRISPR-associated protein Csy1